MASNSFESLYKGTKFGFFGKVPHLHKWEQMSHYEKNLTDKMVLQALACDHLLCGHAVGLQLAVEVKTV